MILVFVGSIIVAADLLCSPGTGTLGIAWMRSAMTGERSRQRAVVVVLWSLVVFSLVTLSLPTLIIVGASFTSATSSGFRRRAFRFAGTSSCWQTRQLSSRR